MSSRLSKPANRIVKLLVVALVVHLFVIPQIGGARKALDVLSSVNPVLLAAGVVLEFLSFLAYARMTQLLLPAERRPDLSVTFGAVMASTGINHVVPGGAATTAAVNYRLLGRAGVPADELGFALGTQAIGSAVVLNVVLWIALLASIPASGFHPVYATAAAVGAVLIAVFATAVVSMLRGRDVLANGVARISGRLPRVNADSVRSVMLGLADQLQELSHDRQRPRRHRGDPHPDARRLRNTACPGFDRCRRLSARELLAPDPGRCRCIRRRRASHGVESWRAREGRRIRRRDQSSDARALSEP